MNTKRISVFVLTVVCVSFLSVSAQQTYTLHDCLDYALKNNHTIKKNEFDKQKAGYARREALAGLLPQINGSANLNYNLKKAKFIMPNFMNAMLPPNMQDPNALDYMTIEMGMKYNANVGVSVNQQLLNFSLFNAQNIAQIAENMATLGVESSEEEIIAQTAALFYAIQSTEYAASEMDKSIDLVKKMLKTMEVNLSNGLVKKVDLDRLKVTFTNLITQRSAIQNGANAQKNMLKFQMGLDVNQSIDIAPIDLGYFEIQVANETISPFAFASQTPYRLLTERQNMVKLQQKSAFYENLPTLSMTFNYQYNGSSEKFFKGPTNYWYPTSLIGLSLRIPIFDGLSRPAKMKEASLELKKVNEDMAVLEQSLTMAYLNANMKLEDSRKTIFLQKENLRLAENVYKISEDNYKQGLSSMSDVLNAHQSLIQAQLSYADALNNFMKAFIDLKKNNGAIRDLTK